MACLYAVAGQAGEELNSCTRTLRERSSTHRKKQECILSKISRCIAISQLGFSSRYLSIRNPTIPELQLTQAQRGNTVQHDTTENSALPM